MKVKSLFIKDYNQFKDFELDLTYPKGHKKEGQPLDKVCIIGQSGTGKTTLLRFVEYMSKWESMGSKSYDRKKKHQGTQSLTSSHENFIFNQLKPYRFEHSSINFIFYDSWFEFKIERDVYTVTYEFGLTRNSIIEFLKKVKYKTIFIHAEQNADFSKLAEETVLDGTSNFKDFVEISPIIFNVFWEIIKNEVKTFQINLLTKRNEFSKLVTDLKTPQSQIQKEVEKLRDWEEKQINPLKKLADEFLDRILNHFNLKVKTEVDFEDIGFIKVETLQGKEVTNDILSTGVKQILLTALPLYALKPEKSIILFDEPERSLYPDIQTQIIDFYTNLAKDCQFFFATHSPLIASSFEPWEIVELKFNEEGNVYREKYFEGENHVDNYKFYPEYLRYDTILSKVFDLPNEANPKRRKVLDEIAILEKQLKNGASQEEKKVLWEQYQALQKKVNWEEDDEKY